MHIWREEKSVEKRGGGDSRSICKRHRICYLIHNVKQRLLLGELYPLLPVVAESYRLPYLQSSRICLKGSCNKIKEGTLSHSIGANNTYLLTSCHIIGEILQHSLPLPLVVQMAALYNLSAHTGSPYREVHIPLLLNPALCPLLKVSEGIYPVFCLAGPCARGGPYPLQLPSHKVAGTLRCSIVVGDPLLPLLKIVGVVALVRVERAVVQFKYGIADTVQEVTVVSNHKEGALGLLQIILQELYHLHIQVVGRLIHNKEIGIREKHRCNCNLLYLSAAKLAHLLIKIGKLKLCEHPLGALLKIPSIQPIHLCKSLFQPLGCA